MQKKSSKELKLDEMKEKLKDFILNDKSFFNLAKKYTFQYREFSSVIDYCHVRWNKKEKYWECLGDGYFCDDSENAIPGKKTNSFLINLSINGYTWSNLFEVMEHKFVERLKETMSEEDIHELLEEKYEEYTQLRDFYFKKRKYEIIDEWFVFYEPIPSRSDKLNGFVKDFINQELKRFEDQFLIKKTLSY